jgi:hypothetical protein
MPNLACGWPGEIQSFGRSLALLQNNQGAQSTLSRCMGTPKKLRGLNVGIITAAFFFGGSSEIVRYALYVDAFNVRPLVF